MTKYEWETELKKNIHRLPPDEIKRVMEYYGELFDDYAERGKRETEIIGEFGNPVDVADKILSEYESENGELPKETIETVAPPPIAKKPTVEEPPKKISPTVEPKQSDAEISKIAVEREELSANAESKNETPSANAQQLSDSEHSEKRSMRAVLFVLLNIATGGAFFIVAGVIWILLGALAVSGPAMALGGVYVVITSIGVAVTSSVGSGIAQIGMGLASSGLGAALTIAVIALIKLCVRATKKMYAGLRDWLTAKKETV